uniref:Uncharacterized protein n=1 Tax=Cucumis sativus TaxID=3659 RepID=A0A0A0LSR1_CUCSA
MDILLRPAHTSNLRGSRSLPSFSATTALRRCPTATFLLIGLNTHHSPEPQS